MAWSFSQGYGIESESNLLIAFEYNGDAADYLSRNNSTTDTQIRKNQQCASLFDESSTSSHYYEVYEITSSNSGYISKSQFTSLANSNHSNVWLHNNTSHKSAPTEYIGTQTCTWKYSGNTYSAQMYTQTNGSGYTVPVTIYLFEIDKKYAYNQDIWVHVSNGGRYNGTISSPSNQLYSESTLHCKDDFLLGGDNSVAVTIVELGANSSSNLGVGLINSNTSITAPVSNVRTYGFPTLTGIYDFDTGTQGTSAYVYGSQSKLYAIHNVSQSTSEYNLRAAAIGTSSSSYSLTYDRAREGWGTWVSYTYNGNKYYAFTAKSTTANHSYVTMNVYSGKQYTFNMHTYSEANYDGIVLSTNTVTASTVSNINASFSGKLASCSGNDVSSSYTYIPSSNGTVYIYLHTDGSGGVGTNTASGDLEVIEENVTTVTVTLNRQGGSGGSTSLNVTPNAVASACPTASVPTRSGFEFSGYYNSTNASTAIKYINADGTWAKSFDYSSAVTFYAFWGNNISYSTYSSASVYCSDRAATDSSTYTSRTVSVASSSASCGTGTATYSISSINKSGSGTVSTTGWSISSDGKTLTIPSGVTAGTYNVSILAVSPSGGTAGTNAYLSKTVTSMVSVTITANAISSYSNPTVSHTTPIRLDGGGQTYTMSPSFSQTAYWNNGASSTITSGASYSYSVYTSCTGFSLSSNKVTVSANESEVVRGDFVVKITCTANGKSGTKNVTFDQEVGTYYDTPVVTRYEYIWFDAKGETRSADYVEYQQVKHTGSTTSTITSGGTLTFYSTGTLPSGFSLESNFSTTGRCTWADMGSTQTSVEKHAEDHLYVKVTMNGKTSAAYYCDSCYQEANDPEWAAPVFSSPTNNSRVSLAAAGQTYTITPAATQIYKLASGYTLQTVTLSSSDFSYAVHTSKTGYSLSSNKVTVTNNTSTSARNGFRVKITASKNSKSTTIYQYYDQPAGSQGYLNPVITGFYYDTFDAFGGYDTPYVTYKQEYGWNGVSGSGTVTENTGGTLTFSTTGTLPSGFSIDSNYSTTGKAYWENNASASTRDAKSNLRVTVTANSKTSSAFTCTSCAQYPGNKAYGTPSVTFKYSTSVPASGAVDLAPSTLTCTQPYTWNGVEGSGGTETVTSSTTFTFTRNANGYTFITNGTNFATTGKINVASRGTVADSARNFYNAVLVTATVNGKSSTAAYASAGKQNANAVESLSLDVASTTISYNDSTTFVTTATYSSGETQNVTANATYSDNPTGVVTIDKSS